MKPGDKISAEVSYGNSEFTVTLTNELQKSVLADYDRYEFHPAAAKLLISAPVVVS